MRACTLLGFLILGIAALAVTPEITRGQPGGGRQFGGKGGGGGPGGGMMNQDPGVIFEMLARGRPFFLISETRTLRDPLTQYSQEKGISNGQINRQQFGDFHAQYKAKMDAGGGASPFGGGASPFAGGPSPFGGKGMGKKGFGGPDPSGMTLPGGAPPSPDILNQLADGIFKRLDQDGDGYLNDREMPGRLRKDLTRWDRNGDGLIDINEFRAYYAASIAGDDGGGRGATTTIIDDDELDRKVNVIRAGKLPANMPDWFNKYDTDGDGQVALYEWRKFKPLDEFKVWDLNDDGFITPEEALRHQSVLTNENPKNSAGSMSAMISGDPGANGRPQFGPGNKGGKGGPGGGKKSKKGPSQDQ